MNAPVEEIGALRAWVIYDAWHIYVEKRFEAMFARWDIPNSGRGQAAVTLGFSSILTALEAADFGPLRSLTVQEGQRGIWLGAPPEWRMNKVSNGWTWHACDGARYSATAYFREDSDSRAIERTLREAEHWFSAGDFERSRNLLDRAEGTPESDRYDP